MACQRGATCSPILRPSTAPLPRLASPCTCKWGQLYRAAQVSVGPSLLRASASDRQDQFSVVLQPVRGQGQLCTAISLLPSVLPGAMDSNRYLCGIRAMSTDMGPSSSSGPGSTMALSGKQVAHLRQLLISLTSSDLPLSTGHEPFSHSLSPMPRYAFVNHNSVCLPGTAK